MTEVWFRAILIVVGSVLGSGGFWAFLRSMDTRRDATTRLMMGLAYIQITTLGLRYIERGSITKDEYEDYRKYFFEPYKALGGNGVAERIMRDVSNLPFRPHDGHAEIFRNREEGWVNNVRVVRRSENAAAE
jgi:hypothetical protein